MLGLTHLLDLLLLEEDLENIKVALEEGLALKGRLAIVTLDALVVFFDALPFLRFLNLSFSRWFLLLHRRKAVALEALEALETVVDGIGSVIVASSFDVLTFFVLTFFCLGVSCSSS